jgi:hypothetical protein
MISKTIRIVKKNEQKSDYAFWKTQSYEARLKALEQIREEYNSWKYGPEQRFQRVYKVIKRT